MIIKLSDYTDKTSGRYRESGEFSGEWFIEDILWPAINSLEDKEKITINFDNCIIRPGFLDTVFSTLISKYKFKDCNSKLKIESEDQNLIFDILSVITAAEYFVFKKVYTKLN